MNFSERVERVSNCNALTSDCLEWKFSELTALLIRCEPMLEEDVLDQDLKKSAIKLLRSIYSFGYELGGNKAAEMISGQYHEPLVRNSIDLARKVLNDQPLMLANFLISLRWYERDEEKLRILEVEIRRLQS